MDFIKNKEVTATDILIALGVPPEIMGLGQKTFSNYKEARLAFYEDTILPLMDSLRDGLNYWLTPTFGDGLYLDYDKDDIEALVYRREQKYTSLQNVNFLTQNEKRESVGYEAVDGWDVFVIGSSVMDQPTPPADPNADPNAPKDPNAGDNNGGQEADPKKPDNSQDIPADEGSGDNPKKIPQGLSLEWKSINLLTRKERLGSWRAQNKRRAKLASGFEAGLNKDFEELTKKLVSTADKLKGQDTKLIEFALHKAAAEFMPVISLTMKKYIKHTLEIFGGALFGEGKSLGLCKEAKANRKFESYVQGYVERHTATQISTISSTTQKNIRRIVGEWTQETINEGDTLPELSKYLQLEFGDLTPNQAMRIARTEVGMASNNGSLEAAKSLQIPNMKKTWVSAEDDRVRDGGDHGNGPDHAAVDGDEVELDDKFTVPPDTSMDGPGDPSAGADQVINCRCVLTYRTTNDGSTL